MAPSVFAATKIRSTCATKRKILSITKVIHHSSITQYFECKMKLTKKGPKSSALVPQKFTVSLRKTQLYKGILTSPKIHKKNSAWTLRRNEIYQQKSVASSERFFFIYCTLILSGRALKRSDGVFGFCPLALLFLSWLGEHACRRSPFQSRQPPRDLEPHTKGYA